MSMDNRIIKSGQDGCPDIFCINGNGIIRLERVNSTNSFLKENAMNYTEGTIVIAKEQTAGRGRLGRTWNSDKGDGIWMSFLLKPDLEPVNCSGITLVTALSLTRALRELTGLNLLIKWPNDIVCNGRKLVGILTEMSVRDMQTEYVVVGMGINVNTKYFPEDIKDVATSLYLEGVEEKDFDIIIKKFCVEFEKDYRAYISTGNMSLLKKEYEELLVNCNKEVSLIENGQTRLGKALGINEEGELLFMDDFGVSTIRAGEVSVRGIYGYV